MILLHTASPRRTFLSDIWRSGFRDSMRASRRELRSPFTEGPALSFENFYRIIFPIFVRVWVIKSMLQKAPKAAGKGAGKLRQHRPDQPSLLPRPFSRPPSAPRLLDLLSFNGYPLSRDPPCLLKGLLPLTLFRHPTTSGTNLRSAASSIGWRRTRCSPSSNRNGAIWSSTSPAGRGSTPWRWLSRARREWARTSSI